MKLDEVYVCEDCGLELKVIKECSDEETEGGTCEGETCVISCCENELVKKS